MNHEYFYESVSDPAPFFGETSTGYVTAPSPDDAVSKAKAKEGRAWGTVKMVHSVAVWKTADDYHKGRNPVAKFQHRCRFV